MDNKLLDNLAQIREKHYKLGKQHEFNTFVSYYEEDLSFLYDMFCKYYYIEYPQFTKLIYQTL